MFRSPLPCDYTLSIHVLGGGISHAVLCREFVILASIVGDKGTFTFVSLISRGRSLILPPPSASLVFAQRSHIVCRLGWMM